MARDMLFPYLWVVWVLCVLGVGAAELDFVREVRRTTGTTEDVKRLEERGSVPAGFVAAP